MAQGYHFPMLPAPFTREELHAEVFGDAQGGGSPLHQEQTAECSA